MPPRKVVSGAGCELGAAWAESRGLIWAVVEAFIRTAERTPLDYLVQPLADCFVRAFRET